MNKEETYWWKKALKRPDGWAYSAFGFLVMSFLLALTYNVARKAQQEPNLIVSFEKQEVSGSILQPTRCTEPLCEESFDHSKFYYNTREINKITITNDSSIEAKRVRAKLRLKPDKPFVFSVITVGEKYSCQEWYIVKKDKDTFKFVEIEIDSIKGNRDDCSLYFVYAYPRSISKRKEIVEENALSVSLTWGGQRKTSPRAEFDLEYHL